MLLLDEPTNTSMPKASNGSSSFWASSRAPWWRSRTTATFSTTPRSGSLSSTAVRASVEGQLFLVARTKRATLEQEESTESARQKTIKRELEWVRQNAKDARPRARRGSPVRRAEFVRLPETQRDAGNLHSGGRPPRRQRDRVQRREQSLRRPAADRRSVLRGAAGAIVGIIGPTARQDHAVSHDYGQGKTTKGEW